MDKILKVKGFGEVAVKPEEIAVCLTISKVDKNIQSAISGVELEKRTVIKDALSVGLKKENIIFSGYNVRQEYEYVQNMRKYRGFKVTEIVEIKFDFDTNLLGNLIQTISSHIAPVLSVHFLADRKNYEDLLLEKAVKDAESKAKILAKASKTKLKGIKNIFYGVNDEATVSYRQTEGALRSASFNDMSVDDIEFSESVVVEWEIE